MKIYKQVYSLTPFEKLNALDDAQVKEGMYLKIEVEGKTYLGDYFPHTALGDKALEEVTLNDPYLQNAIELAKKVDQTIEYRPFKNHLLNKCEADRTTKLKLKSKNDFELVKDAIRTAKSLRLDANGSFSLDELNDFFKTIDISKIEYIEDPSHEVEWNKLLVPSASDFLLNPHAQFQIHKPNRKMLANKNAIISSYMGSDWGRVLCTNFLHLFGDFELIHGIITPHIYQEQNEKLFASNNLLNAELVRDLRISILDNNWEPLA
tara:strand:- start:126300 stop:127091 length:792 start_codon:yes stop_codon:yes gene_type:complete